MPARRKIFRAVDQLELYLNEAQYGHQPSGQDEKDINDYLVATGRERPDRTLQQFVAHLERYNKPRMARIRRDRKWLAKQFEKAGFNPEDSRLLP